MSLLLTPITLGGLALPTRVVMAPMTRNRASGDGVPTRLMAEYYAQRATAGLIVAEMTHVAADGRGYMHAPGIHTDAQVEGWRRVTHAVHERGGRIVLQVAHAGRSSHPALLPDGRLPVAPSVVAFDGMKHTPAGPQPVVPPRALRRDELPRIVAAFADAARRAREAEFDGVEVHAANGYLLDQFIRSGTNRRTDDYGGSASGRVRLLREVVEAVADAWTPGRIGVRVSPYNRYNGMADADPAGTFAQVAGDLAGRGLAFLHVVEPPSDARDEPRLTPMLRRLFGGPVIANGGMGGAEAEAEAALARGEADAVSFGAPFIANPDLVARLERGAPLAAPDRATFYGGDARGYTDYPALHPSLHPPFHPPLHAAP